MGSVSGLAMVALVIVAIFVAVLWVLLPFAVFGLKDLVREAVAQQRRTNELLEQLSKGSQR